MKESSLIFLVSQPRSGSTYLQSLIANHSMVNTTSESWVMLHYLNQLNPKLVETAVNNHLTQEAFQLYLEKFPNWDYKASLKEHLLSLYEPLNTGASYVLDKTPRYWEILPELMELFPNAYFLVLTRNPFNAAKSMVRTWNLNSLNALNKFRRDLLIAPEKLKRIADEQASNSQFHHVSYESLVEDPAKEVKGIMAWLGLEFSTELLHAEANDKIKGKFGDPGQNPEFHDADKDNSYSLDEQRMKEFLQGYADYLGADYAEAFHQLKLELPIAETNTFQNFLSLRDPFEISTLGDDERTRLVVENKSLRKEMVRLKNSRSYRLIQKFKKPFKSWFS